ncbi:hypothetical protein B9Z55_028464 [Caenorhabditis nigoni]|uniref:ABC transporter domain-containing protein n=1 Tax=Caenorhabditis nigoni TaxID=1611254 RepID=A0A2G5SB62_9PELO|nr:hypothetical protein B9Z55_028464 [Caenorhabditis nigoni]
MFNRLLIHIPQHQSETGTPPVLGYIVFDGVEVAYSTRPSVNILNGISLSLEPEKHTALVGHSGNGKSTHDGTRIRYTCGERNVKMLKGQKQRITIAGALVRNPQVLFLDEAVTALDVKTEALVQEAVNRCAQDVSAQGTNEELMEDSEGLCFKLFTRQSNPIGLAFCEGDFSTLRRQAVKENPQTPPDRILTKIYESDNFFMEYENNEFNEKTKWSAEKIGNWFVQRQIRNGVLKETVTEPIPESLF